MDTTHATITARPDANTRPASMVSADSHVIEPPAVWTDILPATFWPNEGKMFQVKAGGIDAASRAAAMAQDAVAAEVLYPSLGMKVFAIDDAAVQEAACRAYNSWLVDYCAADPARLLGVGMVPAFDAHRAVDEVRYCHEAGLRGLMLWQSPHPDLPFSCRHYDPVWAEAERLSLPVSLHILTGFDYSRDLLAGVDVGAVELFRRAVNEKVRSAMNASSDLVLSGVFERFPDLRVVLVENEMGWLPFAVAQWDYYFHRLQDRDDLVIPRPPSDYVRSNVFATFFRDPLSKNVFPWWGADNCMWSNDFPHGNSTWPESRRFIQENLGGLDSEVRYKLLRGNAERLYGVFPAEVAVGA